MESDVSSVSECKYESVRQSVSQSYVTLGAQVESLKPAQAGGKKTKLPETKKLQTPIVPKKGHGLANQNGFQQERRY